MNKALWVAALLCAASEDGNAASALDPPFALVCLAAHYPVSYAQNGDQWQLSLPTGQKLAFDDGRTKTLEETLASPDVKDMFSQRYQRGAAQRELRIDHDPGRIRLVPLFDALYGRPADKTSLVQISFLGRTLRVHQALVQPLGKVEKELRNRIAENPSLAHWLKRFGGAYNNRRIAGTDRTSPHSYGIALDLDPLLGHYWRWDKRFPKQSWKRQLPQQIVEAFEGSGFIWGGRWYHYDTFHFEYRPELLDPSCWDGAR